MNIFWHELRAYRKTTVLWTLTLIGLVILFMMMFPSISRQADEFGKMLEGFPESLRKALGLQISSLGSLLGYYAYVFVYISLCGAIQAMNLGVSLLSKETRERTADFLFTKPVSRKQILTSKLLAAFFSLTVTNIVFVISSSLISSQLSSANFSMKPFLLISCSLYFTQLIFLAIGAFLSIVFPRIKSVLTLSLGTVFTLFIVGLVSAAEGETYKRYFSPFKYFDSAYIIKNESYEPISLLISFFIIFFAVGATYVIFIKRDTPSV